MWKGRNDYDEFLEKNVCGSMWNACNPIFDSDDGKSRADGIASAYSRSIN